MPDLSDLWYFWVSFLMLLAAGIGAPIPEEVPVIGAGIWAAHNPQVGPFRWLILPVCVLGILISDVMLYGIGRFGGGRLLGHRWVKRLLPPDKRARIEENFAHYGIKVLILIRWLPGIRSPMFLTAGIMRVPLVRFLAADAVAAALGHSLLFFLAFWFGDQFRELVESAGKEVNRLRPLIVVTAIAAVALFFVVRALRRPVPTADPKELPLIGEKVAAGIEKLEHGASLFGRPKEQGSGVRGSAPAASGQGPAVGQAPSANSDHRATGGGHAAPEQAGHAPPPAPAP